MIQRKINALFETYPNGRDREAEYTVCWANENGRGETQETVTRPRYLELINLAGEPTYIEAAYRSYTPGRRI